MVVLLLFMFYSVGVKNYINLVLLYNFSLIFLGLIDWKTPICFDDMVNDRIS